MAKWDADSALNEFLKTVEGPKVNNVAETGAEPQTKTCLDCGTAIPIVAKKCPHCQEWQDPGKRQLAKYRAETPLRVQSSSASKWLLGIVLTLLLLPILSCGLMFFLGMLVEPLAKMRGDREPPTAEAAP